jgi:hypothetical protein
MNVATISPVDARADNEEKVEAFTLDLSGRGFELTQLGCRMSFADSTRL